MTVKLQIDSEIGKLQAVILHRPGSELNNLIPRYLEDLLFDEIPWLSKAKTEHEKFAQVLSDSGAKVYYVEDLVLDIMQDEKVTRNIIADHLKFTRLFDIEIRQCVEKYLLTLKPQEIIVKLMAGLHKKEIQKFKSHLTLSDLTTGSYPFYLDPLPSMYFTRDHGSMVTSGLQISSMYNFARRRETIFLRFLEHYYPLFGNTSLWFNEEIPTGIEGGDVLVINPSTLVIGLSERTTEEAIEYVAHKYLLEGVVKQVIVVEIPAKRAYMHLDTVFTMVDYDKFLMYPGIKNHVSVYWMERGKGNTVVAKNGLDLNDALGKALGVSVKIIFSGGGDPITAAREQWGDSTNTLAVRPGVVICYERNEATNKQLRKNGITVLEIPGSELVRGRGGPRCMSMPLSRAKAF